MVGPALKVCPGRRGSQKEDFQCKNQGSPRKPGQNGHPVYSSLLNEGAFQSEEHQSCHGRHQSGSLWPKGGPSRRLRDRVSHREPVTQMEEEWEGQAGPARDEHPRDCRHPGLGAGAGYQSREPIGTAYQEGLPGVLGREDAAVYAMPLPPSAHLGAQGQDSSVLTGPIMEQRPDPPGQEMTANEPGAESPGQQTWAQGAAPPARGSLLLQGPDGEGR